MKSFFNLDSPWDNTLAITYRHAPPKAENGAPPSHRLAIFQIITIKIIFNTSTRQKNHKSDMQMLYSDWRSFSPH